jgi:hypothetical protein
MRVFRRLGHLSDDVTTHHLHHSPPAIQSQPVSLRDRPVDPRAVDDRGAAGFAEEDRGVAQLASDLGDDSGHTREDDGPGGLQGGDDQDGVRPEVSGTAQERDKVVRFHGPAFHDGGAEGDSGEDPPAFSLGLGTLDSENGGEEAWPAS